MSVPDTALSTRRDNAPLVREAVPADYPAIRDVVIAAYRQYADLITLGAWISPIDKMLSMWVRQTLTRCRVVAVPGGGRSAWSATDYRVPASRHCDQCEWRGHHDGGLRRASSLSRDQRARPPR